MYFKYSSILNIIFKKYIVYIVEIYLCCMFFLLCGVWCMYLYFLMMYVCKGLLLELFVVIIVVLSYG